MYQQTEQRDAGRSAAYNNCYTHTGRHTHTSKHPSHHRSNAVPSRERTSAHTFCTFIDLFTLNETQTPIDFDILGH